MTQRRIVSFAHAAVAIEFSDARVQPLVDFLFGLTEQDESVTPCTTFKISVDENSNWIAHIDDEPPPPVMSQADFAEFLLGKVTYCLLDKSRDGVTLHAGVLAWKGRGILVPGAIGAGKTTFTAWLASQGLDFLTDEMVWVPTGTDMLHAFPRPLNVKKPALPVVQTFLDFEKNQGQIVSNSQVNLILPAALHPGNVLSIPPLNLILFPHYQSDAIPHVERLSSAQAALGLAQSLLNLGNLNDRGFSSIAYLARIAPAYRLRYSHFSQIEEPIKTLIGQITQDIDERKNV
jgi:hypothetical protein